MEIIAWFFLLSASPVLLGVSAIFIWCFVGLVVSLLFNAAYKLNHPYSHGYFYEGGQDIRAGMILWPIFLVAFIYQILDAILSPKRR